MLGDNPDMKKEEKVEEDGTVTKSMQMEREER